MRAFGGEQVASAAQAKPDAAADVSKEQELDLLKRQTEHFASALEGIRKRIEELETQPQ